MPRLLLTDELWLKLSRILKSVGIYAKASLRRTFEGILFKLRVGCPWRDLPRYFGKWNQVYKRFNDWARQGKLLEIFENLVVDPDLEWIFIDGSIVKAHQHGSGARSGEESAIGKSRGGNSTKIHLAVDAHGLPVDFEVTGGEVHDSKQAAALLKKLPRSEIVVADKGYDSESTRDIIRSKGSIPQIPRRSGSKIGNAEMDWCLYRYRHLVENAFARLKHFRSISTRYEKLARNYAGMIAVACTYIWLPM